MKILHTADIHIQQAGDDRWQALETILHLARRQGVAVVVISGDLFDAAYQAEQVRGEMRNLLQQFPGKVLIIPGNHDYGAFQDGFFWGKNTHVFLNPTDPLKINDVYFWGIPFFEGNEDAVATLISRLDHQAKTLAPEAIHLLLFHGELLDISGPSAFYGEQPGRLYLPAQLAFFKGKIWQYILAGHFHSNFHALQFEGQKFFVYPGSPISITRKETQRRRVNIFQPGEAPGEHVLETPYYHPLSLTLTPQDTWESVITFVQERLEPLPSYARPLLRISGMFDSFLLKRNEQQLFTDLQAAFPQVEIDDYQATDLHHLLSDDLFQTLKQKIDQRTQLTPEQRRLLHQFLIQVMMEESR